MYKYKSSIDFLNDLNIDYPEKVIIILEMDYTEEEFLDYLELTTLDDFNIDSFKYYIESTRDNLLINSCGNNGLTTNKISNQITGDIYLNQISNSLQIFDGLDWINI